MKIAVLEWIRGGGLAAGSSASGIAADVPTTLLREGSSMLGCLVEQFLRCGHDVALALDSRWPTLVGLPPAARVQLVDAADRPGHACPPRLWLELGRACDLAVVIAPEFDGILATCLSQLRAAQVCLLNCDGPFLATASDKLLTAQALHAAGLPHPATAGLLDATPAWRESVWQPGARAESNGMWIVKPRDGAGCQQFHLCDAARLDAMLHAAARQAAAGPTPVAPQLIVQPYYPGAAFSCSAIVERGGRCHWLPLVTQLFDGEFNYTGGELAEDRMQRLRPVPLLDATVGALGAGALGWIGVDLLYDPQLGQWTVIEVNPRCTTSILGLAAAAQAADPTSHDVPQESIGIQATNVQSTVVQATGGAARGRPPASLGQALLESYLGATEAVPTAWKRLAFESSGQVTDRVGGETTEAMLPRHSS